MVLNYLTTNYIGWPLPAYITTLDYIAKILKISELCKLFSKILYQIMLKRCANRSFIKITFGG